MTSQTIVTKSTRHCVYFSLLILCIMVTLELLLVCLSQQKEAVAR